MQMQMSQQIASQQMLYFPQQAFPMQEHLQPHPAATMGQQLSQGVSQVVYPSQQMQVIVVRACLSMSLIARHFAVGAIQLAIEQVRQLTTEWRAK